MVDAIYFPRLYLLAAAAADGDFDFLAGAVELAAGFDDGGDVAGLGHLDAVGDGRHGAGRDNVGRRQRAWIVGDQERDRGDIRQRRGHRDRHDRAVLGDLGRVEFYLVGNFRGLAVQRLDRVG